MSAGTKTRRAFQASLAAPITPDLRTRAELAVFGLQRDNSSYASSSEALHGVRASVRVSLGQFAAAREGITSANARCRRAPGGGDIMRSHTTLS